MAEVKEMSPIARESLEFHAQKRGKIEVVSTVTIKDKHDLSLAYTPGVAQPCLEIQKDINKSFDLTRRWNMCAVITDGTAVLGLGDIGPEAGMPVMEGKCALFKAFADVDAFPLCIKSKDVDEIVRTIYLISGSFGGINLEDIAAPRCFEIERRLKEICDIPVFHDDQHGTAIVVAAGLINALKVVNKKVEDIKVVVNGAGAAGSSIIKLIKKLGAKEVIAVDRVGILRRSDKDKYDFSKKELAEITNSQDISGGLAEAIVGADVFVGVSAPNLLSKDMVRSMNRDAIVFAMANPTPEIMPEDALEAGAAIVGTGRSDYPNQINNVLVFPGLFKGALRAKSKKITEEMKIAAAEGLASLIKPEELRKDYIIPDAFDKRVAEAVASAVEKLAKEQGICRG